MTRRDKHWYKEEVFALIADWKARPVLWDTTHHCYGDKCMRNKVLRDLASKYRTTPVGIMTKFHYLKSQFNIIHKRVEATGKACPRSVTVDYYDRMYPMFAHGAKILYSNNNEKPSLEVVDNNSNVETFKSNEVSLEFIVPNTEFDVQNHEIRSECEIKLESESYGEADATMKKEQFTDERLAAAHQSTADTLTNSEEFVITELPELCPTSSKRRKLDTEKDAVPMRKTPPADRFQTFGNFVADELRSLSSPFLRRKLKLAIQLEILKYTERDGL